ncbi:MAG TPA: hypothetical protein VGO23_15540 [Pseudonocardia sp.]|jgi:hypothetical protein|nr:hypothetical protein [Pseudonocardia sp.]
MLATGNSVLVPSDDTVELLDSALAGAEANDRHDLIRRLSAARRAVTTTDRPGPRLAALQGAVLEVGRAVDSLRADLRYRRGALADPGRAARLRAELDRARACSDAQRARSRDWSPVLADGFAGIVSDADFALRSRARAVVTETERALESGDPRRKADEIAADLRRRLVTQAEQTHADARAAVRDVAARLTAHLDLPDPLPVPALPLLPPATLVAALAEPEPSTVGRPPVPARLLTVVMPSYGGVMMTFVVPRFLGVHLPLWMLLTAALVGALALGGAALTGDRKRGLDRRRGEARTAARIVVDEFQLVLGKQVRDAVRGASTELRRNTLAALARRDEKTAGQLDSARRAAEGLGRVRADLKDIDDDLATLRSLRGRARALAGPLTS